METKQELSRLYAIYVNVNCLISKIKIYLPDLKEDTA